ncbi:tetratricopeptide repeat protein [Kitasatospora sp. NPDC051853]|uniref:tetratricopeptide repeat protein n=1 Tax=Kitasatospora sp. NPDC051853 TaxID=3364058 RepID=UPI0037B94DCC
MRQPPTVRAEGDGSLAVGGDAHGLFLTNPVFHVFPAPEPAPALPRTLPPQPADFTGREEEIARLLGGATDPVVVVSGKPGVGKTALALHVAHHPDGDFPDGRLYADLRGMAERPAAPEDVMARFLLALGTPQTELPSDPDQLLDAYRLTLAGRRLLLVLDNAGDEQQVRPLLPPGGQALALVTSRSRLVGLEGAHRLDLDTFTPGTALRFLRRVCGPERIDRDLLAAEAVAGYCGGLPLALRITANRLATNPRLSTAALVRELRYEHDRLEALEAGDLTVRAAFGLSYGRLNKAARSTFRQLSQVPGEDFGPGVCAALTGFGLRQAAKELRKLAEANLIEPAPGDERYRLHDLLRLYSKEQLAEETAESVTAAAIRMHEWYIRSIARALQLLNGLPLPQKPFEDRTMEIHTAEEAARWAQDDLAGAIVAARHLQPSSRIVAFATMLAGLCEVTGHWREWDEAITVGLEATELDGFPQYSAMLLMQRANLARTRREFRAAMDIAQQVSEQAEDLGIPELLADAVNLVAGLHVNLGEPELARPLLERSLQLWERIGNRHQASKVRFNLGTLHRAQGDFDTALEYFRSDLRVCEEVQDASGIAETLNTLGLTLREVNDPVASEQHQRRALEIFRQIGNRYKESMVLNDLALTLRHQGKDEEALSMHLQDAELCHALGYLSGEALAKANASTVLTALGRPEEARPLIEEAVTVFTELGDDHRLAQAMGSWSAVLFGLGHDDQAVDTAHRALDLADRLGWSGGRARLHFGLAIGHGDAGRHQESLDHAEAFLALDDSPATATFRSAVLLVAHGAALQLGDDAKAEYYRALLSAADS